MPRPRKFGDQKLKALRFFVERKNAGEDVSALDVKGYLEVEHPEGTASYRLVANWVKEFKGRDDWQTLLDSPYSWSKTTDYGLPWEAGAYLLEMWAFQQEEGVFSTEIEGVHVSPPLPTGRQMIWVLRVHLAVPDVSMLDVWLLAQYFVTRELAHEVDGAPIDVEDLEALLAYAPWEGWPDDKKRLERYRSAAAEGRIPQLKPIYPKKLAGPFTGDAFRESFMAHGFINSEFPELLYSQNIELWKQHEQKLNEDVK